MPEVISRYRTPPDEVRALGIAVTGAGRIRGQTRERAWRTLAGYAGVLVTAGSGHLSLSGRPDRHSVGPGSFFWLPPGIPHAYGPGPGAWDEYWVLFEGPATAHYENLGYLGTAPATLTPDDPAGARDLLARIVELLTLPESLPHHLAASAALHTLVGSVGTGLGARTDPAPMQRDVGHRALDLLDRPGASVRIGAVARELAVSRDTLAAAVRRVTGSTPTDYVMRRRLDRAKVLLIETDQPVARIAREVGYADPAYFTRVFTRHVGVAPTVFRRQQKT